MCIHLYCICLWDIFSSHNVTNYSIYFCYLFHFITVITYLYSFNCFMINFCIGFFKLIFISSKKYVFFVTCIHP